MTTNNIITSYTPAAQRPGTNSQTSTANAALFQSMMKSNQANSAFGIGSVGTKTIIASPFQIKMTTPVSATNATAPVFDENKPMEDYLDIYKSIYDKYAAIYGDGFEFTVRYSFEGNTESMAAERKVGQMLDDFQRELHANIPGEFLSCTDPDFKLKAEKGLSLRETYILYGADETKLNEMVVGGYAPDTIEKLFYLEKYGLEGLSAQGQIEKIMAKFGKGSYHDLNKGLGILYRAGAITADDLRMTISEAQTHVGNEEWKKALEMYDSSNIEEFFKQYYENIIFHMNRMYSEEYDWADVFKNKSSGPYSGQVAKLFG